MKQNENTSQSKDEITWSHICEQIGKERYDPYYTNVYGVNLTEDKFRRKHQTKNR